MHYKLLYSRLWVNTISFVTYSQFNFVPSKLEDTGDQYLQVEMPFNNLMKTFFEDSNLEEMI